MVLAFLFYWGFEGLVLNREGLASLCSLPLRTASPFPFARRDLFVGLATAQSATAPLNAFPFRSPRGPYQSRFERQLFFGQK